MQGIIHILHQQYRANTKPLPSSASLRTAIAIATDAKCERSPKKLEEKYSTGILICECPYSGIRIIAI